MLHFNFKFNPSLKQWNCCCYLMSLSACSGCPQVLRAAGRNSPFCKCSEANPPTPAAARSSRSKDWRSSCARSMQMQSPQISSIPFPTSFPLTEYNNLERNGDQDVVWSLKYLCYKTNKPYSTEAQNLFDANIHKLTIYFYALLLKPKHNKNTILDSSTGKIY